MILFNFIIVTSLWYQSFSGRIPETGILIKKLKNSNLWTSWCSVLLVNLVNEWHQYWRIFCNSWLQPWQILKLLHNSFIWMICFFQSKFSDSVVWEFLTLQQWYFNVFLWQWRTLRPVWCRYGRSSFAEIP